ncbi:MAG: alpha/beta hydrolase [Anaerolineales bacterium]|nr:alpha/beta hydrolase [Anaerolineales bacterium]MCB8991691.1 alpha/beta hydrolase [Ardenticatenaceae bacterium]MCB9005545.1 alpha/beta hydrolase [Ardenticatenaceae bacterium]
MTEIVEKWAERDGVRLHYLLGNEETGARTPLFFVPGGLGAAEDYLQDIPEFAPRTVLAMSLRGQGRSDAPASGYALADFAGDLAAVVAQCGVKRPCLMAYSMAVPIALAYAAQHPQQPGGLILGDYPAHYPKIPEEWVDNAVFQLGRLHQRHVMEAIQRESAEEALWERLPAITCPVLVLRGGKPGARLSEADAARYQELLPRCRVLTFPYSDHALWEPDPQQFINAIKIFLAELDTAV